MRIGYPCINRTIGCSSARTFRLSSYSSKLLVQTVEENLACLERILHWNKAHGLYFFRITSDLVPFASHPVCRYPWWLKFLPVFRRIGRFIKSNGMRISMHPDQFVLLNAKREEVVKSSIRELVYHARVLDLMELPLSARIQIHLGGVYGDKEKSIARFIEVFLQLPKEVQRRLAIENDDRYYNLDDCLYVHKLTGIPVVFDTFHHQINPNGDSVFVGVRKAAKTWNRRKGPLMVDYSGQEPGARPGTHQQTIDLADFARFIAGVKDIEMDIMLEIKDKEKSAIKARALLNSIASQG
ncbi:MAG: UV DNA damage repair endonuclease UvsE [Thermoplasmatales archaeon]|nr:UV DNA damage repair endonuclease UvsE [Thermoplasmatales archaeon]